METFFLANFSEKNRQRRNRLDGKKNSGYFDENPSKSKKFPHHQKWRLTNFRRSFSLSLSLTVPLTHKHPHALSHPKWFPSWGKKFHTRLATPPPLLQKFQPLLRVRFFFSIESSGYLLSYLYISLNALYFHDKVMKTF